MVDVDKQVWIVPSVASWTTSMGSVQSPLQSCAGGATAQSSFDSPGSAVVMDGVAVLSDSTISFAIPSLVCARLIRPFPVTFSERYSTTRLRILSLALQTRIYLAAVLHVWVAGQELASPVYVPFLPPTIQSLSFSTRLPNGTHYFVTIVGSNFGTAMQPSLCTMDGGVVVTVNEQPCLELVMLTVRSSRVHQ